MALVNMDLTTRTEKDEETIVKETENIENEYKRQLDRLQEQLLVASSNLSSKQQQVAEAERRRNANEAELNETVQR